MRLVRQEVSEDANVIFGATTDESMKGAIQVSLILTGANEAEEPKQQVQQPPQQQNVNQFSSVSGQFTGYPQPTAPPQAYEAPPTYPQQNQYPQSNQYPPKTYGNTYPAAQPEELKSQQKLHPQSNIYQVPSAFYEPPPPPPQKAPEPKKYTQSYTPPQYRPDHIADGSENPQEANENPASKAQNPPAAEKGSEGKKKSSFWFWDKDKWV